MTVELADRHEPDDLQLRRSPAVQATSKAAAREMGATSSLALKTSVDVCRASTMGHSPSMRMSSKALRWRQLLGAMAVAALALALLIAIGKGFAVAWRNFYPPSSGYWNSLDAGERSVAMGQFRLALVQALAAVGAAVALLYTARNYRLSHRGQVTERFSKALERLGSEEPYVRLGGILALEQILQDSPTQANHAVQVLNGFVREKSPKVGERKERQRAVVARRAAKRSGRRKTPSAADRLGLPSDIHAALVALAGWSDRKSPGMDQVPHLGGLDLSGAFIPEIDLHRAEMRGASVSRANLIGADLRLARLDNALLIAALLEGADLTSADLEGANLSQASIRDAIFEKANLRGVNLSSVRGKGVIMSKVSLESAYMRSAMLQGADLSGSSLRKADLSDATLVCAGLEGVQLSGSRLIGASLEQATLSGAWLGGADLTRCDLSDADLADCGLHDADLSEAEGLTVQQLLRARPTLTTKLPEALRKDPRVIARISEVERQDRSHVPSTFGMTRGLLRLNS
ncbi:pentapeptide repeat-containing protein [Streptomyces sp. DT2A-34]|uniref:pentapeptide repeat-containing protein n=1 Tax=Streptomyces sp. DT2A-34 TaxID=3051182 RepID=UPI00265C3CED|nr:pentapeptide repeat-containing protein [Streptomyces sp. DT2A-34]MDO0911123.1 pentapeptide repeat-containing protein [Streptomyces sp. DT2A-34]